MSYNFLINEKTGHVSWLCRPPHQLLSRHVLDRLCDTSVHRCGLVSVCLFSRAQAYAIAGTACDSEFICLSVCDCKKSFIEFSCSVSP